VAVAKIAADMDGVFTALAALLVASVVHSLPVDYVLFS
jgi:hypothetical protein